MPTQRNHKGKFRGGGTVAGLDEPPVRLLLGSDAVQVAARVERARAESDARWRDLSVSTDFADLADADLDPLAALNS